MAVTIGSGLQATDDPLSNDLAVSMDSQVANADVNMSQFSTMLMKLSPSVASSFKEEWLEDALLPTNTALSASAASADTNLALTTGEGSYGKAGDVALIVQTGEHVRITTAAASAWTVVRAVGSVSAATAASGTSLGGIMIVAGGNAQGGTLPTALITQKTASYNYAQIVRNSFRFTSTAEWTKWYSGNPLSYHREKIAVEHKRMLEQIAFFGPRAYTADGGNGAPRADSGGLQHFISTNITTVGGTFDKGALNDFLRGGMEYGNRDRKVLFASPIVAQVCSEFLQDNWVRASAEDNVWGVKVDAVIDPAITGNKIPVFVKSDWKRFGEGTTKQIGSQAVLVDMGNVEMFKAPATSNGPRYAALYQNRQARDADERAEEFLSEIGFKIKVEKAHALLRGVTG